MYVTADSLQVRYNIFDPSAANSVGLTIQRVKHFDSNAAPMEVEPIDPVWMTFGGIQEWERLDQESLNAISNTVCSVEEISKRFNCLSAELAAERSVNANLCNVVEQLKERVDARFESNLSSTNSSQIPGTVTNLQDANNFLLIEVGNLQNEKAQLVEELAEATGRADSLADELENARGAAVLAALARGEIECLEESLLKAEQDLADAMNASQHLVETELQLRIATSKAESAISERDAAAARGAWAVSRMCKFEKLMSKVVNELEELNREVDSVRSLVTEMSYEQTPEIMEYFTHEAQAKMTNDITSIALSLNEFLFPIDEASLALVNRMMILTDELLCAAEMTNNDENLMPVANRHQQQTRIDELDAECRRLELRCTEASLREESLLLELASARSAVDAMSHLQGEVLALEEALNISLADWQASKLAFVEQSSVHLGEIAFLRNRDEDRSLYTCEQLGKLILELESIQQAISNLASDNVDLLVSGTCSNLDQPHNGIENMLQFMHDLGAEHQLLDRKFLDVASMMDVLSCQLVDFVQVGLAAHGRSLADSHRQPGEVHQERHQERHRQPGEAAEEAQACQLRSALEIAERELRNVRLGAEEAAIEHVDALTQAESALEKLTVEAEASRREVDKLRRLWDVERRERRRLATELETNRSRWEEVARREWARASEEIQASKAQLEEERSRRFLVAEEAQRSAERLEAEQEALRSRAAEAHAARTLYQAERTSALRLARELENCRAELAVQKLGSFGSDNCTSPQQTSDFRIGEPESGNFATVLDTYANAIATVREALEAEALLRASTTEVLSPTALISFSRSPQLSLAVARAAAARRLLLNKIADIPAHPETSLASLSSSFCSTQAHPQFAQNDNVVNNGCDETLESSRSQLGRKFISEDIQVRAIQETSAMMAACRDLLLLLPESTSVAASAILSGEKAGQSNERSEDEISIVQNLRRQLRVKELQLELLNEALAAPFRLSAKAPTEGGSLHPGATPSPPTVSPAPRGWNSDDHAGLLEALRRLGHLDQSASSPRRQAQFESRSQAEELVSSTVADRFWRTGEETEEESSEWEDDE